MAEAGCSTLTALALREREFGFADVVLRAVFEARCPDWVAELGCKAECTRFAFTECTKLVPTEWAGFVPCG
jgi:hypothetical protein